MPACANIAAPQRDSSRSPARLNWHSLQILAKNQGFSHGIHTTPLLLLITCSNQEDEVEPIVRAVDIGRGNTKFIAGVSAGDVRCAMFPSQAHPCETVYEQEAWGTKRRTVCVPVDDLNYEVGPDAHLASDIFNANVLQHDSYSATPEYLALLLGALHYMRLDRIDLLVLGLPVATYKLKKQVAALERRVTGEHILAEGRKITIARVKAIAQPSGALMYCGLTHGRLAQMRKERNLIIDPGRRTFDWLVTQGMQQIDKRSHSVPRGMFDVLHSIIEGISRATGSHYREYDAIDLALRTGKKPVIFQKEYDIAQHLPLAQKIPEQAVAEMLHYVGDAADIKNIILVGGGAFFYRKALKTAFPHHELQELKDPIFANVKGFQYAGTELAKQADASSTRPDGTEPLNMAT